MKVVWLRSDGDVEFCDSPEDAENSIDADEVRSGDYVAAYSTDGTKYIPKILNRPKRFLQDPEFVQLEPVDAPGAMSELRSHLLAYLERHAPEQCAELPAGISTEDLISVVENAPSGWHDLGRQGAGCTFGFVAVLFGLGILLEMLTSSFRIFLDAPPDTVFHRTLWDVFFDNLSAVVFGGVIILGIVCLIKSKTSSLPVKKLGITLGLLSLALHAATLNFNLDFLLKTAAEVMAFVTVLTGWAIVKPAKRLY